MDPLPLFESLELCDSQVGNHCWVKEKKRQEACIQLTWEGIHGPFPLAHTRNVWVPVPISTRQECVGWGGCRVHSTVACLLGISPVPSAKDMGEDLGIGSWLQWSTEGSPQECF